MAGVPLFFFVLLELGLRVAGFGYPTAFLLKSSNHGEPTFVQNDQFGWRFFGPRAARQPFATSIPREKPSATVRIFVFGESAAYGTRNRASACLVCWKPCSTCDTPAKSLKWSTPP